MPVLEAQSPPLKPRNRLGVAGGLCRVGGAGRSFVLGQREPRHRGLEACAAPVGFPSSVRGEQCEKYQVPRSGAGRTGQCPEPHLGGMDEEPLTRVGLAGPGLGARRGQSWQSVIRTPSDRHRQPRGALQLLQCPFVAGTGGSGSASPHRLV